MRSANNQPDPTRKGILTNKQGNPNPDPQYDLGQLLGRLRTRARLSKVKLAGLLEISDVTIGNWEYGASQPKPENLQRLVEVYMRRGGVFTPGEEEIEVVELWEAANFNVAFDPAWFGSLMTEAKPTINVHSSTNSEDDPSYFLNIDPGEIFPFNEPLHDPSQLLGRQRERLRLLNRVQRGGCVSIVGPRRIGKSWLLTYLKLVAPTELGSRYHLAHLDATAPSSANRQWFLEQALGELGVFLAGNGLVSGNLVGNLGLSPVVNNRNGLELITLQKVVQEFKQRGQQPIICIDEFEGFSNRQEFDLRFFQEMRAIAQSGLCLVTTSKISLTQIVGEYGLTSRFPNIFQPIHIKPFTPQETVEFLVAKASPARLTELEQEKLGFYGQGLPLRLQLAGKLLLEDKILAVSENPHYYRPLDPIYWQQFEEQLEENYQAVVL